MALPSPPPVDPPPPDLLTVQARAVGLPPALDAPLHAALTAAAPTHAAEALVGLAPPPSPPTAEDATPADAAADAAEATAAPTRWVTTARMPLVAGTSFFTVPHLLSFDNGQALMGALEGGTPDLRAAVAAAIGLAPPPPDLQLLPPGAAPLPTAAAGGVAADTAAAAAPPPATTRPPRPAVTDIPSLLARLGSPPLSTLDRVRVVDLRGDGLSADGVAALRLPLLVPTLRVLDVRGNALSAAALVALASALPQLRVLGCEPLEANQAVAVAAAAPGLEVLNGVRVERQSAGAEGDGGGSSEPPSSSPPPPAEPAAVAPPPPPPTTPSPPTSDALLAAIGPATHAYTVARPDNPSDSRTVWYVPAPLGACLSHGGGATANVRVARVWWGGTARDVVWVTRDVPAGGALVRDYAEGVVGAAARAEVLEHFGVQD